MRRPFIRRSYEPVFHHTRLEPAPNQSQQAFIVHARRDLSHQSVVVNSVKELFQIEVDHPAVPRSNMLLSTRYCFDSEKVLSQLPCRTCITACWIIRSNTVGTVSANCTIPQFAFGMGGDPPSVSPASRAAL